MLQRTKRCHNILRDSIDGFERGLELFLDTLSKIAIWIGGGIALAWLARVLWRALID